MCLVGIRTLDPTSDVLLTGRRLAVWMVKKFARSRPAAYSLPYCNKKMKPVRPMYGEGVEGESLEGLLSTSLNL